MVQQLTIFTCILTALHVHAYLLEGTVSTQSKVDMLELLVTEEKQLRRNLEQKVDGLVQQMTAMNSTLSKCDCDSGTMRSPAFTAGLSADINHCAAGHRVVFNSVKVNVANGYNGVNGVFTAPVSGTYAFTATLSVEPNHEYHVALVKNSNANEIGYLYTDPNDIWLERSTTILTHLNAGEKVWMVCLEDSRIEGDHGHIWGGAADYHSHMSGFIVSHD